MGGLDSRITSYRGCSVCMLGKGDVLLGEVGLYIMQGRVEAYSNSPFDSAWSPGIQRESERLILPGLSNVLLYGESQRSFLSGKR